MLEEVPAPGGDGALGADAGKVAITDPMRLRRELDEIRVRGNAVDDVENEPGVVCFGAAVRPAR